MAREFSANVVVANEYTLLGLGSVDGVLTVGTSAVEVKVGASKLVDRTTITVQAHPDNAGYIYLGLTAGVTATTNNFYCLGGGSAITIKLDTTDAIPVYAIGSVAGQKLAVLEGKSS